MPPGEISQSFIQVGLLRTLAVGILPRELDELLRGQADHLSHVLRRLLPLSP